jgi:hypothetical protein
MAYVTAKLEGGLGNQLFQIATAYTLALDLGVNFKISYKNHRNPGQGRPPDRYANSIFSKVVFLNIPLFSDDVDQSGINEARYTYHPILSRVRECINRLGYACITGFFQSDRYFAHRSAEIRSLFIPSGGYGRWLIESRPDVAEIYRDLLEDNSYCFIGVRRGDYTTHAHRVWFNPCGATYYRRAIQQMPAERYYISSDDIEWCKQTFIGPQFHFIEKPDDIAKFALMTLFRRYIISNSTFYWWGSYLSQYDDASVMAPDKWLMGPNAVLSEYYSIYRDDMTVLERPIEY